MRKLLAHKKSICLAAGGLLVGLLIGIFCIRISNSDAVDATILQFSSPVLATMTYKPDRQLNSLLECTVEYRFTNRGNEPTKLSFPPVRVFHFTRSSCFTKTWLPEFAEKPRVVDIAPGETVMFEGREGMLVSDQSTWSEGGPGSTAFVFSRPASESSDDGYCVGTVFPRYYVLGEDEDANAVILAKRDQDVERFIRPPADEKAVSGGVQ